MRGACPAEVPPARRWLKRPGRHRQAAEPCGKRRSGGAIIVAKVNGTAISGAKTAGIVLPGTAPAKAAPYQSGQIAVTAPAMTGTEKPVAFDQDQKGPGRHRSEQRGAGDDPPQGQHRVDQATPERAQYSIGQGPGAIFPGCCWTGPCEALRQFTQGAIGGVMRIFGVILAGGTGRRMGGTDKAALLLGAQPLLARVIARIGPQVDRLAVSANGDPARLAPYRLPVLPDALPQGPLSGVLAALDWAAPQGATSVVSVAVDTPFFPGDLVPQLLLAAEHSPSGAAVVDSGGRVHPTFALWPVALRCDLRAALARGEAKVMTFAQRHQAALARFSDDRAFVNINTPEDLAAAEALLTGAPQ